MASGLRDSLLGICLLLAISGCLAVPTRSLQWAINDINDNKAYYLVTDDNYYKFNRYRQEKESGKVGDLFPGLPSGIEAATWWHGRDKYYFFKDGKYYTADKFGDAVSGPFDGNSLGEMFKFPIEAATTSKGKTFFFQSSTLYQYNGETEFRRFKADISKLPETVDAALSFGNTMHFFKGSRDYLVSTNSWRVGLKVLNVPAKLFFNAKSFTFG